MGIEGSSHCLGEFQDEGGEKRELGDDCSLSVQVRYRGCEDYEIISERSRLGGLRL
jgi:hypothetical protein